MPFCVIEVTEKEWEALFELDRFEYNNWHKYYRHNEPFPKDEELLSETELGPFPVLLTGQDERWMGMTISMQRLKRKLCGSIGRCLCETLSYPISLTWKLSF